MPVIVQSRGFLVLTVALEKCYLKEMDQNKDGQGTRQVATV